MDALKQVRRRDVGHVEGRVLAHEHHIDAREVDPLRRAERVVVPLYVTHLQRLDAGDHLAVAHGQAVRRVMEKPVAARLRLEQKGKGRVAGDPDALDRVHLDRDGEGHGRLRFYLVMAGLDPAIHCNGPTWPHR
jgi:hypothetical protein